MSYEDELRDWMEQEGIDQYDPEDVFTLVTIMPERRIKVTAYLEDKDGNRVSLKDMGVQVLDYINRHLKDRSATPVNSQIFPLISQFMVSIVPRATDFPVADFMFTAPALREGLIKFGFSTFLLAQYLQQHKLKIVTEEEELSEEQIEEYYRRAREAEDKLRRALGIAGEDDEPGRAER